jgi:beta-lactamase regulating signal transducer with metallopeptidase domain
MLGGFMHSFPFDAIGWMIFHSLWQITLIWLLHRVAQWTLRGWTANVRYASACAAFILVIASTVITFLIYHRTPDLELPILVKAPTLEVLHDGLYKRPTLPTPTRVDQLLQMLEPGLPYVATIWAIGTCFRLTMLGLSLRWLNYHLRRAREVEGFTATWQRLQQAIIRYENARLLETPSIDSPATLGWLRPVVLVPIGFVTNLPAMQVELILAHELAHIRRRDYLVNALQSLVETLMFYHPCIWLRSREIRGLREDCCDDLALAATGGDRKRYAEALVAAAKYEPMETLALAAAGGSLVHRIGRLARARQKLRHGYVHVIGALVGLLCLGAVSADTAKARVQERRFIDHVAHEYWGTAIYGAIGESRDNPDLLPALETLVPKMTKGHQLEREEVRPLVDVLSRGARPQQLLEQIRPFIGPAVSMRAMADTKWIAGGDSKWASISNFMYGQAQAMSDREEARRWARAALLLAAQDSFAPAGSRLQRLAFLPDFESLTGYSPASVRQIRVIIAVASNRMTRSLRQLEHWQLGDPNAPPPAFLVETARYEPFLVWAIGNYVASLPKTDPRAASGMRALRSECGQTGEIFAKVLDSRETWNIAKMPFIDPATQPKPKAR